MNYQLLNRTDISQLITSIDPVHQASIVCKYIGCKVIVQNNIIYEVQNNVIYQPMKGNIDEDILVKISNYLSISYSKLPEKEKADLIIMMINKKKFEKMSEDEKAKEKKQMQSKLSNIFLNSSIKKYIPQIKKNLTRNDIEFDRYKAQIHYENGYICLKTLKFKERILGENFITHYINREYKPSTKSQRNEIMRHIKKIYVDDEDRNIILNILGRAMAGLSAKSAKNTFLLGVGSSGKSTCMNICRASFECYFKELKEDTFIRNNPKRDKIFNTYRSSKHILMTCINEMIDDNIDSSSFKKFIEGEIETTVLYEDDSKDIRHQSGLFFTSNTMPKLDMADSGIKRRVEIYYHKSLFVIDDDKKDLIDENKKIFLGNKNLIDEIINQGLLDAWADIIFERSHLLLNKKIEIVYNDNFKNDKKLVEETDNPFKDFIQQELITDESVVGHLISKEDMLFAYKEFIKKPNANILNKTLIDKFRCIAKDLQITLMYDPSGRRCKSKLCDADSTKGCWVNCRFKTETERTTEKEEDIISSIVPSEIEDLRTQNNELKNKILELEQQLAQLQKPRNIVIEIKKVEEDLTMTTEEDFEIENEGVDEIETLDSSLIEEEIVEDDDEDEIGQIYKQLKEDDLKRDYNVEDLDNLILNSL